MNGMDDKYSISDVRSRNMAAIRAKDTKPEIIVRKFLWGSGFRYRLNHPRLPGKPDVVLRKYRTCIFVNGCFWHGHNLASLEVKSEGLKVNSGSSLDGIKNSECCKIPHTNREFWVRKIIRNRERDIEVQKKLATMGWHSITVWECELKPSRREKTLESLAFTLNHIFLENHKVKRYEVLENDGYAMAAESDIVTLNFYSNKPPKKTGETGELVAVVNPMCLSLWSLNLRQYMIQSL